MFRHGNQHDDHALTGAEHLFARAGERESMVARKTAMRASRLAPASVAAAATARVSLGARDSNKTVRRLRRSARESTGNASDRTRRAAHNMSSVTTRDEILLEHEPVSAQGATANRPRFANKHRRSIASAVHTASAEHVAAVARAQRPQRAATANGKAPNSEWAREAILAEVPKLRAFAISLCGNLDQADDFVQETLLRAWAHIDQFQRGTNMAAWLFTILRNSLRSNYRKYRREIEDADGSYAEKLISHPEQNGRLEFEELRAALAKLPSDQRETLILVVASGASYEEAAEICGCRVGTIKSRVHRARARLAQILAIDSIDDFALDPTTQAVLGTALA
jgi:RNA polymerase sigma-70 factor, ECF subfamily